MRTALQMGVEDERRRGEILLDLGTALFRAGQVARLAAGVPPGGGDRARARRGRAARAGGDRVRDDLLASGAHRRGRPRAARGGLGGAGREDSTLRVGLLASLARALEFEGDSEAAARARAEAIAMARRIDDRRGLATVLMGVYWARATTSLRRSPRDARRGARAGREIGDVEGQAEATQWRVAALMALGEIEPAREELAVALEVAQHTRQPFILHVAEHYRSALALLEGQLAEAEAAAERSREWGQLLVGRDASSVLRRSRCSGSGASRAVSPSSRPVIRVLASGDRAGAAWRPGLAAMLAELAMEEQVAASSTACTPRASTPLREGLWLASLTYLADAAGADRARARSPRSSIRCSRRWPART